MGNIGVWRDIAVSFRYEKDLLSRWMRQTNGNRKRASLYMLVFALLGINFGLAIPVAENKAFPILMTVVCVGLVLFTALKTKGGKGARMVDALYRDGGEYRVFIRADEITLRADGWEDKIGYDEKFRVAEHDLFFLVRYRDGKSVFILPKTAVTDEQCERLGGFYKERLGRDYRRAPR